MYLPAHFEQTDRAALHALIRAHPLGAWIVAGGEGAIVANHIPFLLDADRGPSGTLVGHVARANPVWRSLSVTPGRSLVVFQGAQSYVSPSWYAAKREHGNVVPTWNYTVVHAHGMARAVEDREWLHDLVTRLTDEHEAARAEAAWHVSDAPRDYIDGMLDAIVGVEITIERLEGKWKASQNRNAADRHGAASGLRARGDDEARAMAAWVQPGDGSS